MWGGPTSWKVLSSTGATRGSSVRIGINVTRTIIMWRLATSLSTTRSIVESLRPQLIWLLTGLLWISLIHSSKLSWLSRLSQSRSSSIRHKMVSIIWRGSSRSWKVYAGRTSSNNWALKLLRVTPCSSLINKTRVAGRKMNVWKRSSKSICLIQLPSRCL